MLDRLKKYLASLPDRRKRMNEKFSLQNIKRSFQQDNLLDRMQGKESVKIES